MGTIGKGLKMPPPPLLKQQRGRSRSPSLGPGTSSDVGNAFIKIRE